MHGGSGTRRIDGTSHASGTARQHPADTPCDNAPGLAMCHVYVGVGSYGVSAVDERRGDL